MDMKNIIKNENDRKNLIWESLKDMKKNLNNYSINSSNFNTARSLVQQISQQQFESQSNEDDNQNILPQNFLQQEQITNQFRSSQNFKINDYTSHHREEECAFSKIDTNLLEIPSVMENLNSSESLNIQQSKEVNEFRRIPISVNMHSNLENNQNEFRKKCKNDANINGIQNMQKYVDLKEINNSERIQNDFSMNEKESYRKETLQNIQQQKLEEKLLTNEAFSFRKQREPSCDQQIKNTCDSQELNKKQINPIENQENTNEIIFNLQKENEDLKKLISKIRKENHQRIQQIMKENETKVQEQTESNNEKINQLKQEYEEELTSKEEDIQTMVLLYQGEQQKNSQEEINQKQQQSIEENIQVIQLLKNQLEENIQEKNILFVENQNLQKQLDILKDKSTIEIKDKQIEINQLGENYEIEIQNVKKEMNDKINQINQDNQQKIDIFIKQNMKLEDQVVKLERSQKETQQQNQIKDIQIESLKSELKQTKEQYEQELQKQQLSKNKETSYQQSMIKEVSNQQQPIYTQSVQQQTIYSQQPTSTQHHQQSPVKRGQKSQQNSQYNHSFDINKPFITEPNITTKESIDKENINIQQIPQIPSRSIQYNFIEQKDTSTNKNTSSSNINPKSSLNNHYNKKLRILRTSNNTSLNSSILNYPDSHKRGQSLVNQSLNDSYYSNSNIQQQQLSHNRNYSIERECNIKNPYVKETDEVNRSQFFPHSKSNSNLNTQRRALSTHVSSNQINQQRQIQKVDSSYINMNHNRSFLSESDTSKGNLDFLTINQNICHNISRESPLRLEEEYNIIQQQQQQTQFQQQINQDISIISKPQLSENYTSQVNEYNYTSNKLQDKIEIKINNQKQIYKLNEKENYPNIGNYSHIIEYPSKEKNFNLGNQFNKQQKNIDNQNILQQRQNKTSFQSALDIQQKLAQWDNMDELEVDDEDQDGLMCSIKDLQSKIKQVQK